MKRELSPYRQEEGDKQYLKDICDLVKPRLPDGYGFIVFAFPFETGGRMFYASNAQRDDAVKALREWLTHAEAGEFRHGK